MNYIKIEKDNTLNGDGVRVVLWVSGCTLNCYNCHNPEAQNFNNGILFDDKAKEELYEALSKPWIQGLTLSGGHPLEDKNCDDNFYHFIKKLKSDFPNKDIWCYTGWTWEQICEHDYAWKLVTECVDVLIDGPYIEKLRDITLKWRGSSNQRIINVKHTIECGEIICLYD